MSESTEIVLRAEAGACGARVVRDFRLAALLSGGLCLCLLLLGGLGATKALASNEAGWPKSQVVEMSADAARSLAGNLWLLRDPDHTLTIQQVSGAASERFQPLGAQVAEGFTTDTIWLRMVMRGPAGPSASGQWWLTLTQALMNEAVLYEPDGQGGFIEHVGAGKADPASRLGAMHRVHRKVGFLLAAPRSDPQTYYLRLRTDASMTTDLVIWPLEAFERADALQTITLSVLIGAFALAVLIFIAMWAWSGEGTHLLYGVALLSSVLATVLSDGWLIHLAPHWPREAWLEPLGAILFASLLLWTWFTLRFIQLAQTQPSLNRSILTLCSTVTATGTVAMCIWGYRTVIPLMMAFTLVNTLILAAVTVLRLRQGSTNALIALVASSLFWLGISLRFLRNIGLLDPGPWIDNAFLLGYGLHALAMGAGVFFNYAQLNREKERAEARIETEHRLRGEQRQFMVMVSHELRSPLAIISASVDNLRSDPGLPGPSKARADKILRASERMRQLMETCLANERYIEAKPIVSSMPQDLMQLCRLAIADLEDSGVGAVRLSGPDNVPVHCDAELIRLCLHNLLINARRHSLPEHAVEVRVAARAREVSVAVSNQGQAIPADEMPNLFNRFFRGKSALDRPGAGLGLSIVKTVVEQHHGHVAARNCPDGMIEFTVTLPRQAITKSTA